MLDVFGKYVFKPQNIAVQMGSRCVINCRLAKLLSNESGLRWTYRSPETTVDKLIYNGYNVDKVYQKGFSVEGFTQDSRNLVISSTEMSDAGQYSAEFPGTLDKASAELIVIGEYSWHSIYFIVTYFEIVS